MCSGRLHLSLPLASLTDTSVRIPTLFTQTLSHSYTDDDVLMAIPELYRYGREGTHFGLGMFSWYMLDAMVQVSSLLFPFIKTNGF